MGTPLRCEFDMDEMQDAYATWSIARITEKQILLGIIFSNFGNLAALGQLDDFDANYSSEQWLTTAGECLARESFVGIFTDALNAPYDGEVLIAETWFTRFFGME